MRLVPLEPDLAGHVAMGVQPRDNRLLGPVLLNPMHIVSVVRQIDDEEPSRSGCTVVLSTGLALIFFGVTPDQMQQRLMRDGLQ